MRSSCNRIHRLAYSDVWEYSKEELSLHLQMAKLVPLICAYSPLEVLFMFIPRVIAPLFSIDGSKFDIESSWPFLLHAATGISHW
jgi:hypothetical protein